jgi:hypothetical protein
MSSKIISCYLMGGLGNQLFQIFTTIAYGIRSQRKIVLPYSETLTTGKERPTYWNSFLNKLIIFTTQIQTNYSPYTFLRYNEQNFKYTNIPFFEQPEIMLFGYFQSYLYFEQEIDAILSMIQFKKHQDNIRDEFTDVLSGDKEKRLISMHFRLGDYKLNPNCHPIMPFEYYYNALSRILLKHMNNMTLCKVLYFCEKEDNTYVKLVIDKLYACFPHVQFVKVGDDIDDWKQMLLMSCCHDNIIANSSFSWWGGYFNSTPDKIVCYPSVWFGPSMSSDVTDLFPPTWSKITW